MTTIVCDKSSMVADKRITSSVMFRGTKIFRVKGALLGISGDVEQAMRFVEWRKNPEIKPQFAECCDIEILELTEDGKIILWSSELIGIPIEEKFYAIGSGAQIALGALSAGATPKQAIKIAAKWDNATGAETQTMKLKVQ